MSASAKALPSSVQSELSESLPFHSPQSTQSSISIKSSIFQSTSVLPSLGPIFSRKTSYTASCKRRADSPNLCVLPVGRSASFAWTEKIFFL